MVIGCPLDEGEDPPPAPLLDGGSPPAIDGGLLPFDGGVKDGGFDAGSAPWEPTFMTWVGDFMLDEDGQSDTITLSLSADAQGVLIRVRSPDVPLMWDHCLQIEDVRAGDGDTWVLPADNPEEYKPYCTSCSQRVAVELGFGLYQLPNDGLTVLPQGDLSFRVALRDCASFQPLNALLDDAIPSWVAVDILETSGSDEGAIGTLRIQTFVVDSSVQENLLAFEDIFSVAKGVVEELLGAAHLVIEWKPILTPVVDWEDRINYSRKNHDELIEIYERAQESMVDEGGLLSIDRLPVFLAPCLISNQLLSDTTTQPDGFVPRIPGGFALLGSADGVWLKGNDSTQTDPNPYWFNGEWLGIVLAHEIGHYLGLFHAVEAQEVEDHIEDTGPDNLMNFRPLTQGGDLTPQQINVIRQHPMIQWP